MTVIDAIFELLASAPLPGPVYHLDVVQRYLRLHPDWVDDHIPACDGPGDSEWDYYTTEWDAVTCPGCKAEVERLRAEARATKDGA